MRPTRRLVERPRLLKNGGRQSWFQAKFQDSSHFYGSVPFAANGVVAFFKSVPHQFNETTTTDGSNVLRYLVLATFV